MLVLELVLVLVLVPAPVLSLVLVLVQVPVLVLVLVPVLDFSETHPRNPLHSVLPSRGSFEGVGEGWWWGVRRAGVGNSYYKL